MSENDTEKRVDDAGAAAVNETEAITAAVLNEKLADAQTPGFWAEFAPDEAEMAGAFEEAALGVDEAAASDIDLSLPWKDEAKDQARE